MDDGTYSGVGVGVGYGVLHAGCSRYGRGRFGEAWGMTIQEWDMVVKAGKEAMDAVERLGIVLDRLYMACIESVKTIEVEGGNNAKLLVVSR